MFRSIRALFTPTATKPATRRPDAGLKLESLEDRLALSVTSAAIENGTLVIRCDDAASQATVTKSGTKYVVKDATTNFQKSFTATAVRSATFHGNAGDDSFANKVAGLPCKAFGYAGNDTLNGNSAADQLFGGNGDDLLNGFGGDDKLYGHEGDDRMYGGDGRDVIHGGVGTDLFNGGAGFDKYRDIFDPTAPVVDGYARTDVIQGNSGTCVFLSSLVESVDHLDMNDHGIVHTGGNWFKFSFLDNGAWKRQNVFFDGSWTDNDVRPGQLRGDDGTPTGKNSGEFWTLLYQRGWLKFCGVNTTNEDSKQWTYTKNFRDAKLALAALSGRAVAQRSVAGAGAAVAQRMHDDLVAGKMMVTGAPGLNGAAGHAYAVLDVFQDDQGGWKVKLYNPWGTDRTNKPFAFENGDLGNDGEITVTWAVYTANFSRVYTA